MKKKKFFAILMIIVIVFIGFLSFSKVDAKPPWSEYRWLDPGDWNCYPPTGSCLWPPNDL